MSRTGCAYEYNSATAYSVSVGKSSLSRGKEYNTDGQYLSRRRVGRVSSL